MRPSRLYLITIAVTLAGASVLVIVRPTALVPHPVATSAVAGLVSATPALRESVPATGVVYVAGAVVRPGVYRLASAGRVSDAIARAGGAKRDADLVAVNLAAHVADGQEIVVPRVDEAVVHAPDPTVAPPVSIHRRKHRRISLGNSRNVGAAEQGATVDLNRADVATLGALPGIGPTLAERIVAFRALNGPFASVDGLGDVAGITPARLDALTPFLVARP